MKEIVKRACAALGVDPAKVLGSSVDEEAGQVTIIEDRGIAGCPKLTISFSDIPEPAAPAEKPAEAEKPKQQRRTRKAK
jgi:hypothetical protein